MTKQFCASILPSHSGYGPNYPFPQTLYYPNLYTMAFVGMYQYEDGSREVAGIFDTVADALKFSKEAGFDLVGK